MALLIAYTRVSSEMQKDNTSLDNQRRRIEAYCVATGHQILAWYEESESASGRCARPQLDAALEVVKSGSAQGLICMALDRFARNTAEGLRIAADLKTNGKDLVILNLNLDTSTPVGQCVFTVLLAFAELERNVINERCRAGQKAVKDAGGYFSGHPPYGWDAHEKKLVINPMEQRVRGLILKWHQDGMSFYRISDELNRHRIPAKRGGKWFPDTVRRIVVNRADDYKLAHIMELGDERAS